MSDYINLASNSTIYPPPAVAVMQPASVKASIANPAQQPLLLLQGRISKESVVSLQPAIAFTGKESPPPHSDYQLSLTTASGQTITRAFAVNQIDHDTGDNWYFTAVLPWVADITRVTVTRAGQALAVTPLAKASKASASSTTVAAQTFSAAPEISEAQQQVTVRWDNRVNPWLGLSHIAPNGSRNALILHATGGSARVSSTGLPAGGEWEISLSDGLNTHLQKQVRR